MSSNNTEDSLEPAPVPVLRPSSVPNPTVSPNNAEDSLEPAPVPVLRPSVPNPTASSITVHDFLVQFLLSQDWKLTQDEAQEKAEKIRVDGKALYELPEKVWMDAFGSTGETIYHALQTSKYGYYRMAVTGLSLKWLEQWFSSWVFSTEDSSFDSREISETTESLSPSRLSPQYSSSSTCSAIARGSSTANGLQNDSRSEEEKLQQDHGGCGRPQASFEDSVDSIRFRRLFSHDVD